MPKKTKQYGWQCSECDKGDPSVQISNLAPPQAIDLEAPRASRTRGQPSRVNSVVLSMSSVLEFERRVLKQLLLLQATLKLKVLGIIQMIWSQ